MNNNKMRIIALLTLFSVILSTALFSCADNSDEKESIADTTEQVTEPVETEASDSMYYTDEAPTIDFEKGTINILVPNTGNFIFEEPSDNTRNQAHYIATLQMEERFNCDMKEISQDSGFVNFTVRNLLSSGSDDYDFITPFGVYAHTFAEEGKLYSFDDLVYIDLTKGYWDQSLLPHTTIGDKVYSAYGTCDFEYFDCTRCLVFNKEMIAVNGLENPYDLVNSGDWTFDKMYGMMTTVSSDLNGDGNWDQNDVYGFLSTPKEILPNFWTAGNVLTIVRDADNLPVLNIDGNTRLFNIVERCFEAFRDSGVWYPVESDSHYSEVNGSIFQNGNALFADYQFYSIVSLRTSDIEFGILPYPKFDADQKNYVSRIESGNIVVVPITNDNPEELGAFLEAMASTGYKEIHPAYVEATLKSRDARDEESAAMVQLILDTRTFDLGDIWYCDQIRDGMFTQMWKSNNRNIASTYKRYEKTFNKVLETTRSAYTE